MQDTILQLSQIFSSMNERPTSHPQFTFVLVTSIIIYVPASLILSRKYPREFYLLWYIFSFMLFLFFALHLAAGLAGKELKDFLGPFTFVYTAMTSENDEMLLVGSVLYLGLGPQLLTYLLCGPYGAASPPVFVRQIQAVVLLSVTKFLVGAGGIKIAEAAAALILGKNEVFETSLREGAFLAFMAFAYAALHFRGMVSFSLDLMRLVRRGMFGSTVVLQRAWMRAFSSSEPRRFIHEGWHPFLRIVRPRLRVAPMNRLHLFFTRHTRAAMADHSAPEIASSVGFKVNVGVPLLRDIRQMLGNTSSDRPESDGFSFDITLSPSDGKSP